MHFITRVTLLVALLGLAACANGFGNSARLGAGNGVAGSSTNPTSPAYFNQTIGDRVFFAVDDSTLSDAARATLDAQAGWLMKNPEYSAIIEGHTDERGTRAYNLALGARRASAARDYLVNRGVASDRLRTVSYGKERPVATCSQESCYSKNRRAVTVVTAKITG